jgi:hypothetical protein
LLIAGFSRTERTRGIADLLAELLQIVGNVAFGFIGELAGAQQIGTALHARIDVVIVQAFERAAQFGGSTGLRGAEFARLAAHLLREMGKIIRGVLAVADHLVDIRHRRLLWLLVGGACCVHIADDVAHLIRLLLLAVGEFLCLLSHLAELARGVLLFDTTEKVGRLTEAIRFERLFGSLLTAVGCFLCTALGAIVEVVLPALLGAGRL